MSDNLFGYSNSDQSLSGITTISDGSGANISNGNATFINTTTNSLTVNGDLTIPSSGNIILSGYIYIPITTGNPTALLITSYDMYTMYTASHNSNILLSNCTYDTVTRTLTFQYNLEVQGNLKLTGYLYLPTYSTYLTQAQLYYLKNVSSDIQTQINNIYSTDNTFSGNCTFSNALSTFSGTATNANNIQVSNNTGLNKNYLLTFANNYNMTPLLCTGYLYFNTSTNILTLTTGSISAPTFTGALSGNSSTCTTATNINLSNNTGLNKNYYIPFSFI